MFCQLARGFNTWCDSFLFGFQIHSVRYRWLTEHYSSIAVYQLSKENVAAESTSKSNNNGSNKSANQGLWKIAMRVKNNCEGPFASKLKTAGEADDATSTCPAVACPLVNGNVYHMLDEFNHHHQHCGKCGFRQPCHVRPQSLILCPQYCREMLFDILQRIEFVVWMVTPSRLFVSDV
jgi:hypothetical protein